MQTSFRGCACSTDHAPPAAPLDLRELAPPEPLQRALAAADTLVPGQSLVVLTPLMPMPLLTALAERGLDARAEPLAEGGTRVTIRCHASDATCGDGQAGA
ncbi:DUF2249 domain-containing protein [Dyella halodurans]|uniref:DUF2249 domain-containing protein n=1 Tax=Dyella halodurans TaxID=1920171 RepID=A0ABV9BWY3_9GAMM|nr:DUF2249 domain-containing protein [Dyella halodurans]